MLSWLKRRKALSSITVERAKYVFIPQPTTFACYGTLCSKKYDIEHPPERI